MTDHDPELQAYAAPASVGEQLRQSREAQGLALEEVASRTRIPLRHLAALEDGNYAGLPSPTYAVGFARAYARTVGADEVAVARQVRADLDRLGPRTPDYVPYETADPSRVPSRGVVIVAAGAALAVLVLAVLWFGTTMLRGGASTSTAASEQAVATASVAAPMVQPSPAATPTGPGQVTLTANDEVWLRVYDAAGKTLYIGNMKAGDRFDVPSDAADPMINVGRPDKLTVTLNGAAIPPLGDGSRPLKDVKVGPAAIAARLNGAAAAATVPIPAASPTPRLTVAPPRAVPTPEPSPAAEPAPLNVF